MSNFVDRRAPRLFVRGVDDHVGVRIEAAERELLGDGERRRAVITKALPRSGIATPSSTTLAVGGAGARTW